MTIVLTSCLHGGIFDVVGVLVEIVAGEGGDDAKLFAEQLFDAYLVFAAKNGIEIDLEETGPSKWSILSRNQKAASLFEQERGGHCIQRVPSNGRGSKHTSYAVVMVSQLIKRCSKMSEYDLEESFQRGHGKGGQHQNKTSSAVRLRHKPTGLEVFINGRDQGTNRQTAREALAGKLDLWTKNQEVRTTYSGAGRGSKIRTYNLQDRRVTDHRTGAKCTNPDLIFKQGRFDLLR